MCSEKCRKVAQLQLDTRNGTLHLVPQRFQSREFADLLVVCLQRAQWVFLDGGGNEVKSCSSDLGLHVQQLWEDDCMATSLQRRSECGHRINVTGTLERDTSAILACLTKEAADAWRASPISGWAGTGNGLGMDATILETDLSREWTAVLYRPVRIQGASRASLGTYVYECYCLASVMIW